MSPVPERRRAPGPRNRQAGDIVDDIHGASTDKPPRGLELLGEMPRAAADAAFRAMHPDPTILLLMRFKESPVLRAIDEGIRTACLKFGREVVRADDRDFTGELWANVALCLHNSDLVVAVLEEIEDRHQDFNVMIELGFALASQRRCLILVESRRTALPSVLQHRLTREFNAFDLPGSIERQVADWLRRDVGLHELRIQDQRIAAAQGGDNAETSLGDRA